MIYSPPNRDRKNIPLPERPDAVTSSNFLSSSIGSHNNNSFSTNQIEGKYTVNAKTNSYSFNMFNAGILQLVL